MMKVWLAGVLLQVVFLATSTVTVNLAWDASTGGSGALRYQVQISRDGQVWSDHGKPVLATRSAIQVPRVDNLQVRVLAIDELGQSSDPSNILILQTATRPPTSPGNLRRVP